MSKSDREYYFEVLGKLNALLEHASRPLEANNNTYINMIVNDALDSDLDDETPLVGPKGKVHFTPKVKVKMMQHLNSLSEADRSGVFTGSIANAWGAQPVQLRKWFNQYKSGRPFKAYGRPPSISHEEFFNILSILKTRCLGRNCLSGTELILLITESYSESHRGLTKVPDSTRLRIVKAILTLFSRTTSPNRKTKSRFLQVGSPRRLITFYALSKMQNRRLTSENYLLNCDETHFRWNVGSNLYEEFYYLIGERPEVVGSSSLDCEKQYIAMWMVESCGGSVGHLLFILKCNKERLPGRKCQIHWIPDVSPYPAACAQDAILLLLPTSRKTEETNEETKEETKEEETKEEENKEEETKEEVCVGEDTKRTCVEPWGGLHEVKSCMHI